MLILYIKTKFKIEFLLLYYYYFIILFYLKLNENIISDGLQITRRLPSKDLSSDLVSAMVHCEASIWRLIDFPRHPLRRHDHRTIARPR